MNQMGACRKCGSEKTRTQHTDGYIVVTCKDCGGVVEERYGPKRRHVQKSEAEEAAETVQG